MPAQVGGVDGPVGDLRGQIHQGVVGGGGLGSQGVHSDAADTPVDQTLPYRQIVHQVAPGGVHQNDTRLHLGDQIGVYHVPGLVVNGAVEGEDVAGGGQLLQGQVFHPEVCLHLGGTAVETVIVHLAAEGLEPPAVA